MILTIGKKLPLKQSKSKDEFRYYSWNERKNWLGGSIISCLSHPVAKTSEMQKPPGHSSLNSKRIVLLLPFPACLHRGSQPRPIPFPGSYSDGSVRDGLPLTVPVPSFPLFHWPDNICLCLDSQKASCSDCQFISLLCNLTSSAWFPVIASNSGKGRIPQNRNDHTLNSQSIGG